MDKNFDFVMLAKRILRELVALTGAIQNGLQGIKQQIGTERTQEKANKQNYDIQPFWVYPILAKHEQAERERRANDERQYRVQNSLRWATWLAFIAAAIYAGIAAYQAHLTRQSIQGNQESFNLMQRQVEGIVGANIQRQFVVVWPNDHAHIIAVLMNRGKTVATDSAAKLTLDVGGFKNGYFSKKYSLPWSFNVPEIFPDPEMPKEREIELRFSEDEFASTTGVPKAVKITGIFTYYNGFQMQTRSVCEYILGDMIFYDKQGGKSTSGAGPVACDEISMRLAGFWQQKKANQK